MIMMEIPYVGIFFSLLFGILVFAYSLKIFEGPLSDASLQNFNSYPNSLWVTIITITTVGYGDIYPKTHFGRFVGISACLAGYVMISLFVITLTNMLNPSIPEHNAYNLMKRLEYRDILKKKAVNVLTSAMRHHNAKVK